MGRRRDNGGCITTSSLLYSSAGRMKMSISEDLVFINSVPIMINMPNLEDVGIYSADQEIIQSSAPGKIVTDISNNLYELLDEEKAKGLGIEVSVLAQRIDSMIEDYNQELIDSGSDYFIFKEFHCYVNINKETAAIVFVHKPNEYKHDKDLETIERVKETTRRVISSILKNDETIRNLYEEQGEAVLYLYGYNLINKNSPIALYFLNISYEDWLKKYNRDPEEFLFLVSEEYRDHYMMDHDLQDYINYWNSKLDDDDEIEEASYSGDDIMDDLDDIDDPYFDDDFDDDDIDDEDEDDDSDLPPLPWN